MQAVKLGNHLSLLTTDMEGAQGLEFALLDFRIALVQYFLRVSLVLLYGMVTYILCLGVLEVCNCFLILQEVTLKRLPQISENIWTFNLKPSVMAHACIPSTQEQKQKSSSSACTT